MGQKMIIELPVDPDNIESLNKTQLEKKIKVKDEFGKDAQVSSLPINMTLKRVEPATVYWWEGSPGCITINILGKPFTI